MYARSPIFVEDELGPTLSRPPTLIEVFNSRRGITI